MPWFKAKVNIRCNGKRYVQGQVVELDEKTAALNDNFEKTTAPVDQSSALATQLDDKGHSLAPPPVIGGKASKSHDSHDSHADIKPAKK